MKQLQLLNSRFDAVTVQETLDWSRDWIDDDRHGYICTVNVAMLMMMRSNGMLQRFVDGASLIVADGQPLVWASRLCSTTLPERVTGVDLLDDLCGLAATEGYRIYLLGAQREVVEATVRKLQSLHPGLQVVGADDGHFGPDDAPKRAKAIRESRAQLLFLGMGVPRQEEFLDEYSNEINVNLAIPVGGSFEIMAGTKKRAPQMVQRIGLEWFYRLSQEPGRLWKRYLLTNTQFLYHLAKEQADPRGSESQESENNGG